MKKYYSQESLIKAGKRICSDVETVSFDLFDTLLIRRIHDPDLVKLPVARYIASLAQDSGHTWSWQRVQKLRDSIEKEHRRQTGTRFIDQEACYPDFMRETLSQIFGSQQDDNLLELVTDFEMQMENTMLVPRQALLDWLGELSRSGKRIFVVSDIYLPADHLKRLVKHAGFLDLVEDVVSSADSFLAKASGKAFPLLQERYNLDPAKWLHVGDNPISDGVQPEMFGIRSLVLHDALEKKRKAIIRRQYNYAQGRPFWRGRTLQQLMQPLEGENIPRDSLYVEGYNFLAPLIGSFVQYIGERSRQLGISKIFFLSREGWTFKRFWEKTAPILFPDNRLPQIEYLYVSRMALAGCSCAHQGLTQTNADIAFLPAGNRDFRDVCRIFGLNYKAFEKNLNAHKLAPDTVLSHFHDGFLPANRLRFNEMLEDTSFQNEVKQQVEPASSALHRYLEDVGFFEHRDVAIVDIGWLGTIQRFLYEAVAHREDCPRFHGFLFGATRGIPYPATQNNMLEGVVYDRHRFDLATSTILYTLDLFEEACRAPHPTLNEYKLTQDGYELIFRNTEDKTALAEKAQDDFFAPLQEGLFDAAERFAAASALLGYTIEDYRPWLRYLVESKLAFPKTREILEIRHRHHLDDFYGQHKPQKKYRNQRRQLWESGPQSLRFSPFLRLRHFARHLRERISE